MNLQIVSDLHLEFGAINLPLESCDVLIAAGDIHVGIEGLNWLRTLSCPVIYVAGNHEYWGEDINLLTSRLRKESDNTNVKFLENSVTVIGNVRFIGCTLWTDFNEANHTQESLDYFAHIMNDFQYIADKDKPVELKTIVDLHKISKEWLFKELNKGFKGKTIVVTHHAPSLKSWAFDESDIIKYAYCNQFDTLMKEYSIDLWVHGHIHSALDYTCSSTRVVCNPRGYQDYQLVKQFELSKIISI